MSKPIIYGPSYSPYVRTARLALEEKGAAYELVPIDIISGAHKQPDVLARNPFGKLPALTHDGLTLYETSAITRYIDRTLPGPPLQPQSTREAARVDQVMSIVDSFTYPSVMGQLVWQRLIVPMLKGQPDEAVVAASLPQTRLCLSEFGRLLNGDTWFGGRSLSLADLHLAPLMAYLAMTPEGPSLLAAEPEMAGWWDRVSSRRSMTATQPQFA